MTTDALTTDATEALAERLFAAALGAVELQTVQLGDRLGLYRALAGHGSLTPDGLAARAGIAPRYAREWLEQQAAAGLVDVDDEAAAAADRRYALPEAHAPVLVDADHPAHLAPLALQATGSARALPLVEDAFRTGAGVPYAAYGADFRHGVGGGNRPSYLGDLPHTWLAAMPDLHSPLVAGVPARIADVGCGQGWAAIGVALAFPNVTVHGVDPDEASIADARRHAEEHGVADRVTFSVAAADTLAASGPYDLVLVCEVLHDIARPVEALAAIRASLGHGGSVFVADENCADHFHARADEVQRFFHAYSVTHCLPTQLADDGAVGVGTCMRDGTFRAWAAEAGFTRVEDLPVEHLFFRFRRLRP
jgi:2-polyprenyl-3-methyl-5-hydroxy-6-metoxy-1,4-benzoquinol methylase